MKKEYTTATVTESSQVPYVGSIVRHPGAFHREVSLVCTLYLLGVSIPSGINFMSHFVL